MFSTCDEPISTRYININLMGASLDRIPQPSVNQSPSTTYGQTKVPEPRPRLLTRQPAVPGLAASFMRHLRRVCGW